MAAKSKQQNGQAPGEATAAPAHRLKPSSFIDTRVIYCGDNLEQLKKLPDACVDLVYIDPPFNSNRMAIDGTIFLVGTEPTPPNTNGTLIL